MKNEADNSVYLEAEGKPDKLLAFFSWCHFGPEAAKVEHLDFGMTSKTCGYEELVME